jgi:hypothetical protein
MLAVALAGCAWLFQDHLPSEYTGRSEPMCTSSAGWATVDGVFAVLNVVGVIGTASDDQLSDETKRAYIVGGVIWGLIHVASGATGAGWASECRKARADFNEVTQRQALRDAQRTQEEARQYEVRKKQAEQAAASQVPRGFYCASSLTNTTISFCVRDKAECERTREVSIGAVPDVSVCTLVESAWCYGDRCFTSQEVCNAQSARAGGLACVEVK